MLPNQPPLTLTIPSDPRMLSVARAFLEAACQIGKLDKPTIHAVVLAAGEAISNIIRHAHHDRPGAQLQIQCWIHPDAIELRFFDHGAPFDVAQVPHFDPTELRLGGRGVYMMRRLMDELSSWPRPGGGNVLKMLKRRYSEPAVRDCG